MVADGSYIIEIQITAPRIRSDFKPQDAPLIEEQRARQKRRERKLKRFITIIVGYVVIAWMLYLIAITARNIPKLYNPYDVLGVSEVSRYKLYDTVREADRVADSRPLRNR